MDCWDVGVDWDHMYGSKSCIDLIISLSGVKPPQLSAGDAQQILSPANPDQKHVGTFFPGRKQIRGNKWQSENEMSGIV